MKRREFSKVFLGGSAGAAAIITAASFVLMWHTGDLSPLAYIIPGIFAELSAATGFYYWKAKAENTIKLDMERQRLKLTPGNDPGETMTQGIPDAPDPEEGETL